MFDEHMGVGEVMSLIRIMLVRYTLDANDIRSMLLLSPTCPFCCTSCPERRRSRLRTHIVV